MSYVDSKGRIRQDGGPLTHKVWSFLSSFYFGVLLFFTTLFNPAQNHKLPPSTSLKARRNIQGGSSYGGGGGGGGGGPGKPGGRGGMSDFTGTTVGASQSCCGASY